MSNSKFYISNCFKYSPNKQTFGHLQPASFAYTAKLCPTPASHRQNKPQSYKGPKLLLPFWVLWPRDSPRDVTKAPHFSLIPLSPESALGLLPFWVGTPHNVGSGRTHIVRGFPQMQIPQSTTEIKLVWLPPWAPVFLFDQPWNPSSPLQAEIWGILHIYNFYVVSVG